MLFNHQKATSEQLHQFKKNFSWSTKILQQYPNQPLEYLWYFDVQSEIKALWSKLIDTSTFNQSMNLPPISFEEREGRVYGHTKYGLFSLEWEEVSWQWEDQRTFQNARIYKDSFLYYIRGIYLVEPLEQEELRIWIYFGWIPRNWIGKMFILLSMNILWKRFPVGIQNMVSQVKDQRFISQDSPKNPLSVVVEQKRLEEIKQTLIQSIKYPEILERLSTYIQSAPDHEIDRIRLRTLAKKWDLPLHQLLSVTLHATRQGLFVLTWDLICPHCRGSRKEVHHLGEIPQEMYCSICEVEFDPTDFNTLEVIFHVHPSVRKVEKVMFCSAEPSQKLHIKMQLTLEENTEYTVDSKLREGLYRLRQSGVKKYDWLEISSSHSSTGLHWSSQKDSPSSFETQEFPQIKLDNPKNTPRTFMIEEYQEDQEALRTADLFNLQEFRDLFTEEAIASGIKLDIGTQIILFTDVIGSTKFYMKHGDGKAFAEIQKHFIKVFELITHYGGAVVKTIGDATMATFSEHVQALQSAIALQKYFVTNNPDTQLLIRATLHSGSCLAVNLNSNIDYFGSTVNYTAKLQACANAEEIVLSQEFYQDTLVQNYIRQNRLSIEQLTFQSPHLDQERIVYRITL